jgi:hypothetical protein
VETFQNQSFFGERTDSPVIGRILPRFSLKRNDLPRLPERNVDWQGPILDFLEPLSGSNPQNFPQAALWVGNLYFHDKATIFTSILGCKKQNKRPAVWRGVC